MPTFADGKDEGNWLFSSPLQPPERILIHLPIGAFDLQEKARLFHLWVLFYKHFDERVQAWEISAFALILLSLTVKINHNVS